VEGYTPRSYGAAFADVYDDWYTGISDAEVSADVVVELARTSSGDRRPRAKPSRLIISSQASSGIGFSVGERAISVQAHSRAFSALGQAVWRG
jgi:hypothetical protein